jgi:hypothetical protein
MPGSQILTCAAAQRATGRHFSGTSVAPPVTAARSEQMNAVAMAALFLGRANLFL